MQVIAKYRRPRDCRSFLKAFRFWLLDQFDCGLNEDGPGRGGGVEFDLDFDTGHAVYVVVAGSKPAALEAMLTPAQLKAVMALTPAARKGAIDA
ncbi:hypothetical protein [Paludisphaera sp.]|uniref:hypothetical protein n=1 Tax=Paludisphaera sp. TaxID=2017432 RepID=UPI00301BE976